MVLILTCVRMRITWVRSPMMKAAQMAIFTILFLGENLDIPKRSLPSGFVPLAFPFLLDDFTGSPAYGSESLCAFMVSRFQVPS